jgi:hypothetical protein
MIKGFLRDHLYLVRISFPEHLEFLSQSRFQIILKISKHVFLHVPSYNMVMYNYSFSPLSARLSCERAEGNLQGKPYLYAEVPGCTGLGHTYQQKMDHWDISI